MTKINVLVIDDSTMLHRNFTRFLADVSEINLIGQIARSDVALQKIKTLQPDVAILNLTLNTNNGLTVLKEIMSRRAIPIVVIGPASLDGKQQTLEALALGAVDFISGLPNLVSFDTDAISTELTRKIKIAYASKFEIVTRMTATRSRFQAIIKNLSGKLSPAIPEQLPIEMDGGRQLIAIAASTGGPVALQYLITHLPANFNAGLVIVLHIAPGFTQPLAARLNDLSAITVREAQNGDRITPGIALIAPAELHLTLTRSDSGLTVRLNPEPAHTIYRPSADILFTSIAKCCAYQTCAVILTGMGHDGAQGLQAIRQKGGYTIAQDQATSVVYGMPRRAVELGGVDISLPLDKIATEIVKVTAN